MRRGLTAIIKQVEKLEEELTAQAPAVIIDFKDYDKDKKPRYYRGDTGEEITDEEELDRLCKAQPDNEIQIFWEDNLPSEPVELPQVHVLVQFEE